MTAKVRPCVLTALLLSLAALPPALPGVRGETAAAGETSPGETTAGKAPPAPHGAFPLVFDSEEIHLSVAGDSLEVDGTYWLVCGREGGTLGILYPFPADPRMGEARAVRLEIRAPGGAWAPVDFAALPNGAALRCQVPLLAADTLEFHAVYRQALRENYGRYIVTTTRAWGRPLRRARFTFTPPPGMRLASASYPFELEEGAEPTRYAYQADGFWPAEDILVEWEPAPPPR